MSQTEISASVVNIRARTKKMVEIKEKRKLNRSASVAQAKKSGKLYEVQLTTQKRRKNRGNVQNRVGRKTKICRKQLKGQETTNWQTSKNKNNKAEQQIKEKLDRPTPEMPGMHQPSAFSKNV